MKNYQVHYKNTKIVLTYDICQLAALDIADLDYTFSDFSL